MALDPIKPGGWGYGDPLTSDQVSQIQALLARAIDGQFGGFYSLAEALILEGGPVRITTLEIAGLLTVEPGATIDLAGLLEISGEATVSGSLEIASGAMLKIPYGGFVDLLGELTVRQTGELLVDDFGAMTFSTNAIFRCGLGSMAYFDEFLTLSASGTANLYGDTWLRPFAYLNVLGDATISLLNNGKIIGASGAEIRVSNAVDLTINSPTHYFRLNMTPIGVEPDANGDPSWTQIPGSSVWRMRTRNPFQSSRWITFALPLIKGDVLDRIFVRLNGVTGHSPLLIGPPIELITIDIDGVVSTLASTVDPNGPAQYDVPHSVVMNNINNPGVFPYTVASPLTSDVPLQLAVRVGVEHDTGMVDPSVFVSRLLSISGRLLAKGFRGNAEFY